MYVKWKVTKAAQFCIQIFCLSPPCPTVNFTPFYISCYIQLVLLIWTWMGSQQPEHGKPARGYQRLCSPKNGCLSSYSFQLPIAPQYGVALILHLCWNFSWVKQRSTTATMGSWVQYSCHDHHFTALLPILHLLHSLCLFIHISWTLEREGWCWQWCSTYNTLSLQEFTFNFSQRLYLDKQPRVV